MKICLLQGHGTKKDEKAARVQFEKAAAKGDHNALNALGWYALERDNDPKTALNYFERADALGNADAPFNLGHMYLTGRTPDRRADKVSCIKGIKGNSSFFKFQVYLYMHFQVKAFNFMSRAAMRHSVEGSLTISTFNMRGHPKTPRNIDLAMQ